MKQHNCIQKSCCSCRVKMITVQFSSPFLLEIFLVIIYGFVQSSQQPHHFSPIASPMHLAQDTVKSLLVNGESIVQDDTTRFMCDMETVKSILFKSKLKTKHIELHHRISLLHISDIALISTVL